MTKYSIIIMIVCSLVLGTSSLTAQEPQLGDTREDEHGIAQVWVPAGCFLMGTSDAEADYAKTLEAPSWAGRRLSSEKPQHEVCLTQGYWLDQYEVTNAAFQAFVEADGYTTEEYWSPSGWEWLQDEGITAPLDCPNAAELDHPRACITWYEAEAYAHWRGGSLPTEAQWEFAARGTESLIYPWGNEWVAENANVIDSVDTMPVGSYPDGVSWVGAYDMAGNVMEWVQDWLSANYKDDSPRTDPTGNESGGIKIEKGGWWGSNSFVARSAYRHFEDPPTYEDHHIGFRIVTLP